MKFWKHEHIHLFYQIYYSQISFEWTIPGPNWSYSSLVIQFFSKAGNFETVAPPIQFEILESSKVISLTGVSWGAIFYISFYNLSLKPLSFDVPPERMILPYNSFLIPSSAFWID